MGRKQAASMPFSRVLAGIFRAGIQHAMALSFLIITTSLILGFGYGSQLPAGLRQHNFTFWSLAMLIGTGGLCLTYIRFSSPKCMTGATSNMAEASWIGFIPFLCLTFYLVFSTLPAILASIAAIAAMVFVRLATRNPSWPLSLAVTLLILLMFYFVYRMGILPDDPGMDLLPITKAAIHHAFVGEDPYLADYTTISSGPFYYLPLEWITYAPFELTGINLRWVNFTCWVAIIGLFELTMRQITGGPLARLLFYPLMSSYPVFQAMDTQVPPQWLGVTCFMVALLHRKTKIASLILAYLIFSSQVMLAIAVSAGAYFVRVLSARRFAAAFAVVVGITGLVLSPFILYSPDYLNVVFVLRPHIASAIWALNGNAENSVSFNNLLHLMGLEWMRTYLQILPLLAAAGVLLIRPPRHVAGFLFIGGLGMFCAIALNSQVLRYYFYTPLLMVAWGGGIWFGLPLETREPKPTIKPEMAPAGVRSCPKKL